MSQTRPDWPRPTDFDKFLPWVCAENSIETEVIINRVIQKPYKNLEAPVSQEELSKRSRRKLKVVRKPYLVQSMTKSETMESSSRENTSFEKSAISNENTVVIETIYNSDEDLVALKFLENKAIPGKIMQLIAMTFPYQKKLTSITINSGLRMDSLNEISKFLPNSQINELCFDGTFLKEANYHILLTQSMLKHLSLARCTINDDVVKMITDQLKYPCPAAKVLSALNLSNNKITDTGAKYIADMLRTNRQLCYLNLAGNMITDEGGVSILEVLQKFPVESQELRESRVRYVAHLKEKNVLINEFIKELQTAENTNKKLKKTKLVAGHGQSLDHGETDFGTQIIKHKAETLADAKLGLFDEAFSPKNTKTQDGVVYCMGNNAICCLNFAYNNLSYPSVKKLHEVLLTQQALDRSPRGLIKVVIEGNLMPAACKEYIEIDNLLKTGLKRNYEASTKKKPQDSKAKFSHSVK